MDGSARSKQISDSFDAARDQDLIRSTLFVGPVELGLVARDVDTRDARLLRCSQIGVALSGGCKSSLCNLEAEDRATALSLSNRVWETMDPFASHRAERTGRGWGRLADENSP